MDWRIEELVIRIQNDASGKPFVTIDGPHENPAAAKIVMWADSITVDDQRELLPASSKEPRHRASAQPGTVIR